MEYGNEVVIVVNRSSLSGINKKEIDIYGGL